jgi:hypothetical protein
MVPAAGIAQNASPPAPELQDFRLEKPVPPVTGPVDPAPVGEPAPEPTKKAVELPTMVVTAPKAEPSAEVKTLNSTPKPASQVSPRAIKAPKTQAAPTDKVDDLPQLLAPASDAVEAIQTPESNAEPVAGAPAINSDGTAPKANPDGRKMATDLANGPLIPALTDALTVGFLIFLGWLWNRRRRVEDDIDAENTLLLVPTESVDPVSTENIIAPPEPALEHVRAPEPMPTPTAILPVADVPAAADLPVQKPVQKIAPCEIELAFTPDRVVISFISLTLYGDLAIHNKGQSAAFDIRLQTELISANANQEDDVAGFFAKGLDARREPLDDIAPGEKINLALALVLPLAELHSFAIGPQKLTVPILLARLDFRSGKGMTSPRAVETLSCLIGREASPPTPKMGPLRLDMGARSFTGLGQRSLAV